MKLLEYEKRDVYEAKIQMQVELISFGDQKFQNCGYVLESVWKKATSAFFFF